MKARKFDIEITLKGGVVRSAVVTYRGGKKLIDEEGCKKFIGKRQAHDLKKCPDEVWAAPVESSEAVEVSTVLPMLFDNALNCIALYGKLGRDHPDVPR